ncbi:MAG: trimethylamine methyltransferase family protein, partial [Clostridiales bacterium]
MVQEYFGLGFHFFEKEDLEAIHDATLEVMMDVGINVYGKEAHELLIDAGCKITEENRIHFPAQLVNDAITSAPSEFLMAGRESKFDALQKPGKVTYTNFGTGIMIDDPFTGEWRKTTKHDLALAARVCDAVDEVDTFTIAIAAQDVPEAIKG